MVERLAPLVSSAPAAEVRRWDGEGNGSAGSGVGQMSESSADGGASIGGDAMEALFTNKVELCPVAWAGPVLLLASVPMVSGMPWLDDEKVLRMVVTHQGLLSWAHGRRMAQEERQNITEDLR